MNSLEFLTHLQNGLEREGFDVNIDFMSEPGVYKLVVEQVGFSSGVVLTQNTISSFQNLQQVISLYVDYLKREWCGGLIKHAHWSHIPQRAREWVGL